MSLRHRWGFWLRGGLRDIDEGWIGVVRHDGYLAGRSRGKTCAMYRGRRATRADEKGPALNGIGGCGRPVV